MTDERIDPISCDRCGNATRPLHLDNGETIRYCGKCIAESIEVVSLLPLCSECGEPQLPQFLKAHQRACDGVAPAEDNDANI